MNGRRLNNMSVQTVNMIDNSKAIEFHFNNKIIRIHYIKPLYLYTLDKGYRYTTKLNALKALTHSLRLWFLYFSQDSIREIWKDYIFRLLGFQLMYRKLLYDR